MELVKPTAEIWEQGNTLEDMWKHIARCTRVCYQSTPKNDKETDDDEQFTNFTKTNFSSYFQVKYFIIFILIFILYS